MGEKRKIILVSPHGFCAGVERAVKAAEIMLKSFPKPVYCLKQIVHNRQIVDRLSAEGMLFVNDIHEVPRGAWLLFSAHGVSPQVRETAKRMDLNIVDASCPFVTKVHNEVKRYVKLGYHVILIGHRAHDEIIGVAGEAADRVVVVESEGEAETVAVPDPAKVAVLTQTTWSMDEVTRVLNVLRRRFPALETPVYGYVCYATRHRQEAVQHVARQTDVFIVLGAENSSNSNRLVEVARAEGCKAYLVSVLEQLGSIPLENVRTIGLTAGASTPESCVYDAIKALKERGFTDLEENAAFVENVHFGMPAELRNIGHRQSSA